MMMIDNNAHPSCQLVHQHFLAFKSPTLVMDHQEINMSWRMSLILSATVRMNLSQNEWLWHTLDIGNVVGPTLSLKNSQKFQLEE